MKNKKGFSLVELLIVIAIIGVLAGIIVPSVVKYLKSGKKEYNTKLDTELVAVAKSYYSEDKSKLPKGDLDSNGLRITKTLISASYLVNNNYITGEFKDSEDNDCTNASYVIVEKEDDDYSYTPCIKCGKEYINNNVKNNRCNYEAPSTDGTMRDYILPRCELSYKSGTINNWTNQNVYLTLTAEDNNKLAYYYLNKDAVGTGTPFNKNSSESVEIEIKDNINSNNYYVIVEDTSLNQGKCVFDGEIKIDKIKPKIDSFIIKSNNSSINTKNTTVTIKGSDEGSDVDKVCVNTSNDSSTCTWYDMKSSTYTNNNYNVPSSDGSGRTDTLYAFVKDKAGNISDSKSINYTLYTYCTNTSIDYYGSWGSCSASCGGGTKTRTIYYKDTHFTSQSCGYSSESDSCNTSSCSYSCYKVTTALNCRKSPSVSGTWMHTFYAGEYHWYKYEKYNDGYYWYYNKNHGCYSVDALQEVSSSYCYSGSTSTGGTTPSGSTITGTCTCSARFHSVYTSDWTPYYYSCSDNGLKSSSACKSFCESKTIYNGTMTWNYSSSTCKG